MLEETSLIVNKRSGRKIKNRGSTVMSPKTYQCRATRKLITLSLVRIYPSEWTITMEEIRVKEWLLYVQPPYYLDLGVSKNLKHVYNSNPNFSVIYPSLVFHNSINGTSVHPVP